MGKNPNQVYLALLMFVMAIIAMFAMFFAMSSGGMNWGL